jgi:ATP-dependent helicase/nuclease subunit A
LSLTEEQRRAVDAGGSVVVVAGAGTGKTHMLTERYLHHLSEEGLSPLEVVAVTFTEKAAEELRSRVRERVRGRLTTREDLLAELEAAQISTIHALCARVCREHPDEAGVPADFGILDELRGRLWTADRLADAMDGLPEEHYRVVPYPLMQAALEALFSEPLAAEDALAIGPEGWRDLIEEARESALSTFLQEPALKESRWTLELCEGDDEDRMEESRRAALSALDELERGENHKNAFELLASIDLRGGKKKAWSDGELVSVKEALRLVRELARAELRRGIVVLEPGPADERLAGALPVLRDAFRRARAFLTEAKRRSRVLDFADLEVLALRALEHEEVRDYYHKRWRAFLVDEFQDTNPVQAELLDRLTRGAKLTVVGDEKQSIYGFRRADVEVFRRFRERILSEGGDEVVLTTSFRAHSELVGVLNAVFSSVLGEMRQDLEAHRKEPPHEAPHVRAYAVESEERVPKARLQRAEAAHIARLLREMLNRGVLVGDGSTGASRPIRPGDVAVLSRVWAPLEVYGDALAATGIPSVHAGGGNLLETREAKDGIVLLRFLADPNDDLALVSVLRSPFFAVDDRLLHGLAQERERAVTWWKLVQEADDPQLDAAKEVLRVLLSKRRLEPPTALLQLADHLTGYTAVIANLPGAERREADWRGFRELVGDLERGSDDTFTVVRWLRQLYETGAEVPRPPIEAGDAVSLMTIHAAKGLEWPVVVIPDLARAMPSSSGAVAFDPELGVSVDFAEENGQPALHRLIRDKKARLEVDETRRIFYVAPTRARDHLILTCTGLTERLCGLTVLQPGLELAGIPVSSVPFDPRDAQPPELPSPSPAEPAGFLLAPAVSGAEVVT